jgi:ABC-type oligopeptide transport system substrate-binding subunit
MTRRLSLALAVFLGGTAPLVAPTMSAPAADAPKGGTLRISAFSDVDFVDPALAYAAWSWPIGYATCAKLFTYPDARGAEGTKLIPEVVRTYKVSRDGRTYTFDLNTRFRFHTGAPVTAQSFVDAFNRDANPKQRSPARGFIQEIVGARAVIDGTATSISGVQALARHRLQIRLTRPVGDFIARLTLPFFCPVLPNTPIEPAGINDPPGSGPYWLGKARLKPRRLVFYTANRPLSVAIAEILDFNLKQIGIDLDVKYFDAVVLHEKLQTRGEPFDIGMMGFSADYADGAGFFMPILSPSGANNGVHLDDPRLHARMAEVGRLTGEARRNAWADLDVDLMRDNPPYAPFVNVQNRAFVSRSLGCYLVHPVYGFDIAAVCKKQ